MLTYIAYGSNLHPVRLQGRAASARLLGISQIDGHALRFWKRSEDGSGKATLIADDAHCVPVAVYEISLQDLDALDEAEGLGYGYNRQQVYLKEFGDCFTYVAPPEHRDEMLRPYTWYRDLVLVGCAYHQFASEYRGYVARHPAIPDPNPERRTRNERILARAREST